LGVLVMWVGSECLGVVASVTAISHRKSKAVLATALLALVASCSSGKVDEEIFSLYLNNKDYSELVRSLNNYSMGHGYRVSLETLQGNRPETTAQHILIEGAGVRTLIQSALAEQCIAREGRRDVEYSRRVFDVNLFATSRKAARRTRCRFSTPTP